MKLLEFTTVKGTAFSVVPDKIAALLAKPLDGVTRLFLVGDTEPFEVMGSYKQIKERIKKC